MSLPIHSGSSTRSLVHRAFRQAMSTHTPTAEQEASWRAAEEKERERIEQQRKQAPKPLPRLRPSPKKMEGGGKANGHQNKTATQPLTTPDPKPGNITDFYEIGEVVGKGAFGEVRVGSFKKNRFATVAVKSVDKRSMDPRDKTALAREIAIISTLDHEHVIKFYHYFEDSTHFHLVFEEAKGGELFDRIVQRESYDELAARKVIRILLETLDYLQTNSIAHRDLKPENLMLRSEDDCDIVLIDFGFAARIMGRSLSSMCGTPWYTAPEILRGMHYDYRCDIWSAGVIAYILLCGYPPFDADTEEEMFRRIKRGKFKFHEKYWGSISKDAKNMIEQMLEKNHYKRPLAGDLLKHKWMDLSEEEMQTSNLRLTLDNLREFNAKAKFKKGGNAIVAANRFIQLAQEAAAIRLQAMVRRRYAEHEVEVRRSSLSTSKGPPKEAKEAVKEALNGGEEEETTNKRSTSSLPEDGYLSASAAALHSNSTQPAGQRDAREVYVQGETVSLGDDVIDVHSRQQPGAPQKPVAPQPPPPATAPSSGCGKDPLVTCKGAECVIS